jgi:hypothetical protein
LRIETWISRRSDASAAALHWLSLALLHVNRSLLVHDDCCSIRRVTTRGDRNQNAPTAHRFPVSAGIILQQRCYFQDIGFRASIKIYTPDQPDLV